jgi:hypothetical protein
MTILLTCFTLLCISIIAVVLWRNRDDRDDPDDY